MFVNSVSVNHATLLELYDFLNNPDYVSTYNVFPHKTVTNVSEGLSESTNEAPRHDLVLIDAERLLKS